VFSSRFSRSVTFDDCRNISGPDVSGLGDLAEDAVFVAFLVVPGGVSETDANGAGAVCRAGVEPCELLGNRDVPIRFRGKTQMVDSRGAGTARPTLRHPNPAFGASGSSSISWNTVRTL
jgi:hypothetical protein